MQNANAISRHRCNNTHCADTTKKMPFVEFVLPPFSVRRRRHLLWQFYSCQCSTAMQIHTNGFLKRIFVVLSPEVYTRKSRSCSTFSLIAFELRTEIGLLGWARQNEIVQQKNNRQCNRWKWNGREGEEGRKIQTVQSWCAHPAHASCRQYYTIHIASTCAPLLCRYCINLITFHSECDW